MSRTVKGIFKRLHEAGIAVNQKPEDYIFFSHRLSMSDREVGAYRWAMEPKKGVCGPTIVSSFTSRECIAAPIRQFRQPYHTSEIEIVPVT